MKDDDVAGIMSAGPATALDPGGVVLPGAGRPPQVETPAPAGGSAHSRFVQRIRRRYEHELALLPAGLPGPDTLRSTFDALRARGHAPGDALRILRQLVLERLARLDCEENASLRDVT